MLPPWCGSGKPRCGCNPAGRWGRWGCVCCGYGQDWGREEMRFFHLSVWKQIRWLQALCLKLLLPTLQGLGGGNGRISVAPMAQALARGRGQEEPEAQPGPGLGWAGRRGRVQLRQCWGSSPRPHSSVHIPNVAPEVRAVCGERRSRRAMRYSTAPWQEPKPVPCRAGAVDA